MNLDDIKFIKLLPKFMQNDGCDQGIAEALDDLIRRSMYNVRSLKVWDEIETLNEKQLDELAWELDIDWYDSTADIDTKRDVLRYASSVKRKRGTSWSVQQLITAYFGQGFVYEWTEFDGQPYTFMALTTNDNVDEITLKKFINAVNNAKNERSKLVGVLYLWQHDHEAAELVAYDDNDFIYMIKHVKNRILASKDTAGIKANGLSAVRIFNYKRCGLHRCRS